MGHLPVSSGARTERLSWWIIMRDQLVILATVAIALSWITGGAAFTDSPAERDARMEWWREARFGMFIHWGLYAGAAGEWKGSAISGPAEWIMANGHIIAAEYETLAPEFNPRKFDAKEWVRIAKDAGMKYIVITSKHHDGFAMFDSVHTRFDIVDATPFGRDPMKELAEACAAEGIRLCFYHSILDWHHRDAKGDDFPRYYEHMKAQLRELLTNYGPIGVLWFDGEWIEEWTEEHGRALYAFCREIQPNLIINNRVGKSRQGMAGMSRSARSAGDFGTPEQEVPARGLPGVDWETCMTMNDTWGYSKHDHNWKSDVELIRTLIDVVSKGGNYLLNVGPTALGKIPQPSVERLEAMGEWMKVNGESIYGTTASPFPSRLQWGRCTRKGDVLYLHVFDWPAPGELIVPGLMNEITDARLLATGEELPVRRVNEHAVSVDVSTAAPDRAATVIALRIVGEPNVVAVPIVQEADGSIMLHAVDAELRGKALRLEVIGGRENIGYWTDEDNAVAWTFDVHTPGAYALSFELSCEPAAAGNTCEVEVAGEEFRFTVPATDGWHDFRRIDIGTLRIDKPGRHKLTVEPTGKFSGALMNLRSVQMRLVK